MPESGVAAMTETASPQASFRDRTLAEIATSLPGATGIFRRRKLDFCCGGRVPLAQAAAQRGVAIDELESEPEGVAALGVAADRPESTEGLIELIETRYHAAHRRELPVLVRLARRVEAVHKDKPDVPRGLAALLEQMSVELEAH